MRLRHELLGVLQDCGEAAAAATARTASGTSPLAAEQVIAANLPLVVCARVLVEACIKFGLSLEFIHHICHLLGRILLLFSV